MKCLFDDSMLLLELRYYQRAWLRQAPQLLFVERKVERLRSTTEFVHFKVHLDGALVDLLLEYFSIVSHS